MLMGWIDYFVGDTFKDDSDLFHKVRLLVGSLISFVCTLIAFGPIYFVIPNMPADAMWAYMFIGIPVGILWAYLLFLLRQGRSYAFCANITVFSLLLILYAGVSVTGGPLKTEVHPLLVITTIFGFLLLGQKGGLFWTALTALIYFVLLGVSYSGDHFINLPPEEARGALRVFNWSCAFFLTAALIVLYEGINVKVTRERDKEREKYKQAAQVALESSVVTQSAEAMAASGKELLASVIQQKTAIEQLGTTSEELGATAQQNAQMTKEAKEAIHETEEHLLVSKKDIVKLVDSIRQISTSSEEIQSFNNVINDISYQTNILSLNAMIEASRSSDASGGFKVVAMEVKKLAERSAEAADDINRLLQTNRNSVEQGVGLSETMKQRFDEISDRIIPLSNSIQNVSDASSEQNEAIQQIMFGLVDIDRAIERNKEEAMKTAETATELEKNASSLMEVVATLGGDMVSEFEEPSQPSEEKLG